MVPGLFPFLISGSGGGKKNFYQILVALGLTSNLQQVLDAGSSGSYSSGQKWLDLTPNGYDMFRGANSSSESSDPTFNGVAGSLSGNEYFSTDGGDYFNYDSTTEAWMHTLHHNNALFSIAAVIYMPSSSTASILATRDNSDAPAGIYLTINASGKLQFVASDGAGGNSINKTSDASLSSSAYHVVGVSIDEAGSGFFYADGNYLQVSGGNTFSAAYSSPGSGNANGYVLLSMVGGSTLAVSGFRIAALAVATAAWSKANFDGIYAGIGPRFGLS